MIYNPSLKWSWRTDETISPSFTSFKKMKAHFNQNKPNSSDQIAVMIGNRIWAFYDLDFNQVSAPHNLVDKYFYGAMA